MTTNSRFGGGPSTVVALFAYGDITRQTHACLMRDAVFAGRNSAKCESEAYVIAEACAAVDADSAKAIMERVQPSRNWPLTLTHPPDDALIDRSRALCVKGFLEHSQAEVLVMIDHDQDWRGPSFQADGTCLYEGDICHLARKCAEVKGVVGAAVSKKAKGEGIATMWHEDSYGDHDLGSDELCKVYYVGAAFTAYHRSCLEAVTKSMPEIPPGFSPIFLPMIVPHPTVPGGELHLSEDWALCHRAAALGFDIRLSMMPLVRHWGYYPYDVIKDAMADATPRRKISLIHATRGRPLMAALARADWLSKISGRHEIEYVRVRDVDDPSEYLDGVDALVGEHDGCVAAYNAGAAKATGEILVQVHDDLSPPQNWDAEIARLLNPDVPQVLHVSDGLAKEVNADPQLITIAVVTRKWLQKLGGMFHPSYVSVFCDNDLSKKAFRDGCVVDGRKLVFKHSWAGPDRDETQRRSYRRENWELGQRVLAEREAAGFPDAEIA